MIDLIDLSIAYPDGALALESVNLHVSPEEFVVLIGPSGSGKTTLLRAIAGFLPPKTGSVAIAGEDVSRTPPERRRLGMVFQQHAVWPHLSVAANVAYPLKRAGVPDRRRRVDEALALVGLAGLGARRPDRLSGGQRQRVALARAIVAHPRVLLLDEALSALDEPLRDTLRRELMALTTAQGLTTVHVTHDRAEALALADRIVVLADGHVKQIATPQELLARPASAAVAAFIADATVLPATLTEDAVYALGTSWPLDQVRALPGDTPQLAITPDAVEVTSPGDITGEVTSVLFDRGQFSVTVSVGKHTLRASTARRPRIGERVGLRITRPLLFA